MRDKVIDVLLDVGVPAVVKGFSYIGDAIEIFDTDPYYADGKMSALYIDIAKKNDTTSSRVERAIRHAFETAIMKGNQDMVNKYLDTVNTQNSNLLKTLYLRLKQEEHRRNDCTPAHCSVQNCELKAEIYMEAMQILSDEIETLLARTLSSVKKSMDNAIK